MTKRTTSLPIGAELRIKEVPKSKSLPQTFKVGRDAQIQLSKIERDLFTFLEERESGNYIISGLTQKITENDFLSFQFAVEQILYNQSYQFQNLETNSGIDKTKAVAMTNETGQAYYVGNIIASLNDLCRLAYGVSEPTTEQKKAMSSLVDALHNNPVKVQYPNGYERESVLCARMDKFKGERGAITYNLHLNPIFCSNVNRNFSELPQDFMGKLTAATKKRTAAHLRLARLLIQQNKNSPFTRTMENIITELNLEDSYRNQKARTEKQVISIVESMQKVGLISKYSITEKTIKGRNSIDRITFYFNPNFLPRRAKNKIEDTGQKES